MTAISIILIFIALVIAMLCRSLVHTLLHHFPAFYLAFSKKYKIDVRWWDPKISWKQKYITDKNFELVLDINKEPIRNEKMVQFSDGFHTFNTIELGAYCFIISILMALVFGIWWTGLIAFIITGTLMVLFFNFGYNRLWR